MILVNQRTYLKRKREGRKKYVHSAQRGGILTVSAFDNRGTYTHICVYDYTQMPSQLHTIACSRLGANLDLKQFLAKLLMLKSQA